MTASLSLQVVRGRLTVVLAVLAAAAAVATALAKVTPGVYRRTVAQGADAEAAAMFDDRVVNHIGNVMLDRSGRTRLDLEITEPMVNARLSRLLADEAKAGHPLPPVLEDLRVGFEPGSVVLATRLGQGVSGVAVSQRLALAATPDGRLVVRPRGASVGLVPVPASFVTHLARAIVRHRAGPEGSGDGRPSELWDRVLEALDGRPVDLGKGRKRIVLESVEIDRGVLRARGHRREGADQ